MHCLEITITAKAPLAIGRQKAGSSVSEAETYIPGSVIRGAIAGQILRVADRHNADLANDGGDFQTLFLDADAAVFQNAYPAIARLNAHEAALVPDPVHTLPATAVSSKDSPGFKVHGKTDEKQKGGVFDTLIDRYCAALCHHPYDPSCPKDNGRVEPFSGFYSRTNDSSVTHRYRSHSTTTRFLTRVAINRRRATAQDEMLYSIEVLNESFLRHTQAKYPKWEYVAYRSRIWVQNEALAESLKHFINQHSGTFRIGGGSSRGLGQVHIKAEIKAQAINAQKSALKQRLQQFNQTLRERWSLWSVMQPDEQTSPGDRTFFTLDLQADAILTDRWQRTMVVSPEMLIREHDLANDDLQLHASSSSYDYRSGWNAAWGLMKEMELITSRGAVFLFSTAQPELWQNDPWLDQLANLEIQGIGDRPSEGFGQVRLCDEFHTIFRENAV
ncbi:MAG: CRISPR-associated RAMP protein Csx10 [Stenomitos frigidus ULC029]